MTVKEALTSIAVELHRANNIAERQLKLAEAGVNGSDSMRLLEKFIEPLTTLIADGARKPIEITSVPLQPNAIDRESEGMRVSQEPGE